MAKFNFVSVARPGRPLADKSQRRRVAFVTWLNEQQAIFEGKKKPANARMLPAVFEQGGHYYIELRYGNRVLKPTDSIPHPTIEVGGNKKAVLDAFKALAEAALSGDFDESFAATATNVIKKPRKARLAKEPGAIEPIGTAPEATIEKDATAK